MLLNHLLDVCILFILTLIELSASSLYLFESMYPAYFATNPRPAQHKALSKDVSYKL